MLGGRCPLLLKGQLCFSQGSSGPTVTSGDKSKLHRTESGGRAVGVSPPHPWGCGSPAPGACGGSQGVRQVAAPHLKPHTIPGDRSPAPTPPPAFVDGRGPAPLQVKCQPRPARGLGARARIRPACRP